jgi:Tfp pilus assembly protein PilX
MINLFHNSLSRQKGAVTLVVSIILLVTLTLIILFAAGYNIMQTKVSSNQYQNNKAYEAAEAGLEFGIEYLRGNRATIVANPVSGFITPYSDSNTTNVALTNNSRFTVVYTSPVANNYTLIKVTSTGTNSDGTATKVISQQVQLGSIISSPPSHGLVSRRDITLNGNATIINTATNATIDTGGQVSINGSAGTTTSTGGSSSGNIQSDIQQNNSTLNNQSTSDFFSTYFGLSTNGVKNNVAHYYSNSSTTSYNSLNGMTGTSIWIDQTGGAATLSGSTTIGSAAAPVLLIVNGTFSLTGNVTIYGLVFVLGSTGITLSLGNSQVIGAMITSEELTIGGSSSVTYNASVLNTLKNSNSMTYYAKVAGSWKDF